MTDAFKNAKTSNLLSASDIVVYAKNPHLNSFPLKNYVFSDISA